MRVCDGWVFANDTDSVFEFFKKYNLESRLHKNPDGGIDIDSFEVGVDSFLDQLAAVTEYGSLWLVPENEGPTNKTIKVEFDNDGLRQKSEDYEFHYTPGEEDTFVSELPQAVIENILQSYGYYNLKNMYT